MLDKDKGGEVVRLEWGGWVRGRGRRGVRYRDKGGEVAGRGGGGGGGGGGGCNWVRGRGRRGLGRG